MVYHFEAQIRVPFLLSWPELFSYIVGEVVGEVLEVVYSTDFSNFHIFYCEEAFPYVKVDSLFLQT